MPEEPQDNNQQPDESVQPENNSQYIKQPLPAQSDGNYSSEPVVRQTAEGFGADTNEVANSEVPATPTDNQGPIPAVANPFQPPDQSNIQPVKPVGPNWLKNKKLVIGIAIAAVVVLIGGGSTLAYTSWYQNPDKVLADSIVNAFTAKTSIYEGTIVVDSDGNEIKVEATTKQASATGSLDIKVTVKLAGIDKEYVVNGGGKIDKLGDLYFMVGGLTDVVEEAKSTASIEPGSSISNAIDKIIKKIDGVWIRVSSDDLKTYSLESSTAKTCINKTTDKFKNDSSAIAELTNNYRANPFIVIKNDLGQKDGSFGYEVKNDNKAFKSFIDGLKHTKIYKSLYECDKNFKIDTTNMVVTDVVDNADDGTVELWVGTWSHQVTKIIANSNSDGTKVSASINPKYNQNFDITAPAKYISLSELKSYINDLMEEFNFNDGYQSTSASANASSVHSIAEVIYAETGYYPSTIAQFSQSDVTELPSTINLIANPNLINSENGYNTVSWSCLNSCTNPLGGRIGYFDYDTNTIAWYYAGDSSEGDNFVNP